MTMPSLIQNYKYMLLQNQLKKAYSDLNQASKLFQIHNDMTVSEYAASNTSKLALEAFKKEYNAVLKTLSYKNVEGSSSYTWKDIRKGSADRNSSCDATDFFLDSQGRIISFDDMPYSNSNGPKICIDINGEKAPNTYGLDYFVFMFTTDGYVIPWGQAHKNNPVECEGDASYINCTIPKSYCKYSYYPQHQYACANYALINQHPTDSDKDYWHDFVKGH